MTIQEAINQALEGGYPTQRVEDLSLQVQAQYFLAPTLWEALVRALGVDGEFEDIHLDQGELRTLRQPLRLYSWHQCNSHLIAGNTPESFFLKPEFAVHRHLQRWHPCIDGISFPFSFR
jgi:hypothetical protein